MACHQLQMHMEGRCAAGYYQIALYSQDERWDFHVPTEGMRGCSRKTFGSQGITINALQLVPFLW